MLEIASIPETYLSIKMIPFYSSYSSEDVFSELSAEEVDGSEDVMSGLMSSFDKSDNIEIVEYRDVRYGDQLLVLGTVRNNGTVRISTIQLEAEFTDKEGKFVYECTTYLGNKIGPGEKENFQIKCSCGNNPVPVYAGLTVKVTSAADY